MVIMGEYDGKAACQVVLDTDIYITDAENIEELFTGNTEIVEMNDKLFELYKEALTDVFIKNLTKINYNDNNIIGVESNE